MRGEKENRDRKHDGHERGAPACALAGVMWIAVGDYWLLGSWKDKTGPGTPV
ncbi:MAG: hypothetical protein ACRDT5_04610 [Mycobacterium sp.]